VGAFILSSLIHFLAASNINSYGKFLNQTEKPAYLPNNPTMLPNQFIKIGLLLSNFSGFIFENNSNLS
jgi:hypothetical protein